MEHLVQEAKVRLDPGLKFCVLGEGYLRILIASSEAIVTEALERVGKALQKL